MTSSSIELVAALPPERTENARNLGGTKATVGWAVAHVLAAEDGRVRPSPVVEARWYRSWTARGAAPIWCSVWCRWTGHHYAGHGRATGYGYDKLSASLEAAIHSAGIALWSRDDVVFDVPAVRGPDDLRAGATPPAWGGAGEGADEEALRAITRAVVPWLADSFYLLRRNAL